MHPPKILKLILVTLTLLFATLGSVFAKSRIPQGDRILTIQQWSSEPEAIVWAVLKDKIIVYRTYDYVDRSDQLILERPFRHGELERIQNAINEIPKDAYGYLYQDLYYGHGPLLRFLFTADGSFSPEMIELSSVVPQWSRRIAGEISKLLPAEFNISYEKIIGEHYKHMGIDFSGIVVFKKRIREIDSGKSPKGAEVENDWATHGADLGHK